MRTGSRLSFFKSAMSDHLRGKRDDFHELLVAEFAGHGSEYARSHRFVDFVDQHGRVRIETNVAAVAPSRFLAHAYDHAAHHFALLNTRIGRRFLDGGRHDISETGPEPEVAAARRYA